MVNDGTADQCAYQIVTSVGRVPPMLVVVAAMAEASMVTFAKAPVLAAAKASVAAMATVPKVAPPEMTFLECVVAVSLADHPARTISVVVGKFLAVILVMLLLAVSMRFVIGQCSVCERTDCQ